MQITPLKLLAIALVLAPMLSVSANQAKKANDVLLSAMSPFEDMIGFALAGSDTDITETLVTADQQADGIKKALPASAASQFAALMDGLHKAVTDRDHHEVAGTSVELFRLLTDNLQAKELEIPREVSLLDYVGYKLRVLAGAPKPDWQDIRKTAGEAAGWWNALKSKVSAKGLRDAVESTMGGLAEAARLENLPMLRFGARIDLDLVDLL